MSLSILTDDIAKQILNGLAKQGVAINDGLTDNEFSGIENTLQASIPSDLKRLLSHGVPGNKQNNNQTMFPLWHTDPKNEIQKSKAFVQKAFEFDIRENEYWITLFGDKPSNIDEAVDKALDIINAWPPLIRIYGHRYLPTTPNDEGNPVISIWQASDAIYYGNDLVDYFNKEFKLHLDYTNKIVDKKSVPFWDEAFELHY